jgi:hypothetical protein
MRDQQQVGDASPEVNLKAGEGARKEIGVVGADTRRQSKHVIAVIAILLLLLCALAFLLFMLEHN